MKVGGRRASEPEQKMKEQKRTRGRRVDNRKNKGIREILVGISEGKQNRYLVSYKW